MKNRLIPSPFRIVLAIVISWLSLSAYAVPCYLTLVKDSCWKMYDVTVDIKDAVTNKQLGSIIVPLGTAWGRQAFECSGGETLALFAKFSPAFWKLPDALKPGEVAWNVTVCYPKYFANVPLPPNATSNCMCDVDNIPKISP